MLALLHEILKTFEYTYVLTHGLILEDKGEKNVTPLLINNIPAVTPLVFQAFSSKFMFRF